MAQALDEMGCYEVSMGDTIGVGTPGTVAAMFEVRAPGPRIDRLALDRPGMAGPGLRIFFWLRTGIDVSQVILLQSGPPPAQHNPPLLLLNTIPLFPSAPVNRRRSA